MKEPDNQELKFEIFEVNKQSETDTNVVGLNFIQLIKFLLIRYNKIIILAFFKDKHW